MILRSSHPKPIMLPPPLFLFLIILLPIFLACTTNALMSESPLNVSAAVQAAIAPIPTKLTPIYEENPNLLPVLIYQGTAAEPCTNIRTGLKPTMYVFGNHGYCEDWNYHNITCLIVGRVGRTFMDLNGKFESGCGHYGGGVIGVLGTYKETFGNAWTWGPWNGAEGGISSFSFVPFGLKAAPTKQSTDYPGER